ncbi:FAD:protein FMN transferase [Undibacterium oligocarboniphilum]|uniref:FAD:protein FMN transferase n=1 Tax=Undibacterium oligocarboniphilum TaxID=666702 RepID=A0A850QMK0_9BURK|nr:FAD:protein FMN transferase [Undibacterium oligocarboniphilum]MBC3869572.1 FAD:protein FMN transferase [Undibacterium oligocarboniphilum]NVO77950.1 FAD:protein FMN transferase [Undibacterium oligocarboniphilum]
MPHVFIPLQAAPPAPLPAAAQPLRCAGHSMGTSWQVQLYASDPERLTIWQNDLQALLDQVVLQMSTWEPDSDLCRFNRAPAESWQQLPDALFDVLDYALYIARQSRGSYDPAAGRLVDLWGFGPAPRRNSVPDAAAIGTAMTGHGWRDLALRRATREAWQAGGIRLDLSAIAKGYAVDLLARYLDQQGVPSYLVEVGGELRGKGMKPDFSPWWVQLESPAESAASDNGHGHLLALHGLSVATSGDYRQYFEQCGQRYSHTIDPCTGYPVQNTLAAVSVIHPDCMVADALATAFTVMGEDAARKYADAHRIAALFTERLPAAEISENTPHLFQESMSAALAAMLE